VKYVTYTEPGPPSVLHATSGPALVAGPSDVLIEVEASGVSRADAIQRQGLYPPPPGASQVLGLEVSGSVIGLGSEVIGFSIGDRVCALCNGGGYAEVAAVPFGQVLPIPDDWSFIEAATLPENAFTVFDNVFVRAALKPSETLLVHGGTSGIGSTAIMFATAIGARVFATAGSEKKRQACITFGAAAGIDYKQVDFVAEVLRLTDGTGVNVILDIVGGDYIERDLKALALDGRIACIATAGGREAKIDLARLLQRRATILGSSLRARTSDQKAAIARALRAEIWPLLDARTHIVPVVDSIFPFSQASEAHARLESSEHIGKIILVPDP
jgi:NADPH:quinone reductase